MRFNIKVFTRLEKAQIKKKLFYFLQIKIINFKFYKISYKLIKKQSNKKVHYNKIQAMLSSWTMVSIICHLYGQLFFYIFKYLYKNSCPYRRKIKLTITRFLNKSSKS